MPASQEKIITDHQILLGKPTVRGTRITVELILKKLAQGATQHDILKMYPQLCMEDVNAAILKNYLPHSQPLK